MASLVVVFIFLLFQNGFSRTLPEEEASVVSVYTTLPNTPHHQLDVYHQIANNIAERITSPIYRFLGFGRNTTTTTPKSPWKNIEILHDPEEVTEPSLQPVDNDISKKDVEELSAEALKKTDRKPEKITLFSSYLPSGKADDTRNEVDGDEVDGDMETFGLDDDDIEDDAEYKPGEGPFAYLLEILGSMFTLLYAGIVSLFTGSKN